jgi:CheY-like chemotaxis protein
MRILIVEDHGDSRLVLANLLRHWGYKVTPAACMLEAVQLLGDAEFDVLVSDLELPDGDGIDLANKARAHQPLMKMVALTGRGTEADRQRGKEAGFHSYLIKPIDFQELRSVLGNPQ